MDSALNHFDEKGKARMVDVSEKSDTLREAIAKGMIRMQASTLNIIREGRMEKGDVLGVARVAAVMASKKTSDVIPMCHLLFITGCDIEFTLDDKENVVIIEAKVRTTGKTGVEMEALTAVSIAALTIYDMCKAVDKGMIIEGIHLVKKSGGKSGEWSFKE